MKVCFFDSKLRMEVCEPFSVNSLADVPSVGDLLILKTSKEYEAVYGYDNRSCSVESRLIDYRTNFTVTVFID